MSDLINNLAIIGAVVGVTSVLLLLFQTGPTEFSVNCSNDGGRIVKTGITNLSLECEALKSKAHE